MSQLLNAFVNCLEKISSSKSHQSKIINFNQMN